MSRRERDFNGQPSVVRCLADAALVIVGGVVIAVVAYLALVVGAVVLGLLVLLAVARVAARMVP